jgi:hypothetical protein
VVTALIHKSTEVDLIKYPKALLIIILASQLVIPPLSFAQSASPKAIYINMSFDNHQLGTDINNYKKADKLIANFVGSLKDQLSKSGNTVYITGSGTDYINFEDRFDDAKKKNAQLYLSLVLSMADTNCIKIQYPKFEQKYFKKSAETDKRIPQELLNEIGNATRATLTNESRTLAKLILQSIDNAQMKVCCTVDAGTYLSLKMAFVPTIVLEFQLQSIDSPPQFLTNDTLNKTTSAIATAINKFMSYPIGSPMRSGAKEDKGQ